MINLVIIIALSLGVYAAFKSFFKKSETKGGTSGKGVTPQPPNGGDDNQPNYDPNKD